MRIKITFLLLILTLTIQNTLSQNSNNNFTVIKNIIITGNKKTKKNIILRELLFAKNDTIDNKKLNTLLTNSKHNLFNTSLFNFITINTIQESRTETSVFIILEERWYIFPYPILENADRNFSTFLHNKNWKRINYGIHLTHYNFRGRAEHLKLKVRLGYKEQIQIFYKIPYIGKSKQHSISTEISWYRQKEVMYDIKNDKPTYISNDSKYIKRYHTSIINYEFRNKHYSTHSLSLKYTNANICDSIASLQPNYFGLKKSKTQFLSVRYTFQIDKRDYKFYPLSGYNIKASTQKEGLNIIDKNFADTWSINLDFYQYLNIHKYLFTGFGGNIQLAPEHKTAFFSEQLLGYKSYIRAYEYNVFDGQNYCTTRSFLKYAIIPMNITKIKKWNWRSFNKIPYSIFINLFFDSGYAYSKNTNNSNKLPNNYQYSYGIGLDLLTYYDFIIRLEYSINKNKQHGFFVNIGKAF